MTCNLCQLCLNKAVTIKRKDAGNRACLNAEADKKTMHGSGLNFYSVSRRKQLEENKMPLM